MAKVKNVEERPLGMHVGYRDDSDWIAYKKLKSNLNGKKANEVIFELIKKFNKGKK